jgi:hypothetical protein
MKDSPRILAASAGRIQAGVLYKEETHDFRSVKRDSVPLILSVISGCNLWWAGSQPVGLQDFRVRS